MLIFAKLLKLSQILDDQGHPDIADSIDNVWNRRQKMLPLSLPTHQYSGNALDFIPPDEHFDYMNDPDYPLIHVTGDLEGVLRHGLLSRNLINKLPEKGHNLGLGGQVLGQSPNDVSTTYSPTKADAIKGSLQLIADINVGKVSVEDVLKYTLGLAEDHLEDELSFERFVNNLLNEVNSYLDTDLDEYKERLLNGDDSVLKELDTMMRETNNNSPRNVYGLLQSLENDVSSLYVEMYGGTDETLLPLEIAGLASDYDSVKHLRPNNIETLYLKAKQGAQAGHYPGEAELTFRPKDLYIDDERLEPHERYLMQNLLEK